MNSFRKRSLFGTSLAIAAAVLALTVPASAHAEGFCLPLIGCFGTSTSTTTTSTTTSTSTATDAPEISPAMLGSGLVLLVGTGLVLRSRLRQPEESAEQAEPTL